MDHTAWIYGGVLAATLTLLLLFEYYLAVNIFPTPFYIGFFILLLAAIGIWVGKKLSTKKLSGNQESSFRPNEQAIQSLGISNREFEILEQLAKGQSNQEIANTLLLSVNMVKTHLSSLYQKLNVNRRSMAVKKARTLKLIP